MKTHERWIDTISDALWNLGGTAPLAEIYAETERLRCERGLSWPVSARAVIRRELASKKPDSPFGGDIEIGHWRLKSYRSGLLAKADRARARLLNMTRNLVNTRHKKLFAMVAVSFALSIMNPSGSEKSASASTAQIRAPIVPIAPIASVEKPAPSQQLPANFYEVADNTTAEKDGHKTLPGIRNNNPLNIHWTGPDVWDGQLPRRDTTGAGENIVRFSDIEDGYFAAYQLTKKYINDYGLTTMRQIKSRWSEAHGESVIRALEQFSGLSADAPLDLDNPNHLVAYLTAQTKQENAGGCPWGERDFTRLLKRIHGDDFADIIIKYDAWKFDDDTARAEWRRRNAAEQAKAEIAREQAAITEQISEDNAAADHPFNFPTRIAAIFGRRKTRG